MLPISARFPRFLATAVLLCWHVVATPAPAFATAQCDAGGTRELALEHSGPYLVAVGVIPPKPVRGDMRMVVRVCDTATREAIPNAEVFLLPTSPTGARGAPVPVLSKFRGPEEYSVELKVKSSGRWNYLVQVTGPQGAAALEVTLDVGEPTARGGNASLAVFALICLGLGGGSAYLYLSSKRALRERQRSGSNPRL